MIRNSGTAAALFRTYGCNTDSDLDRRGPGRRHLFLDLGVPQLFARRALRDLRRCCVRYDYRERGRFFPAVAPPATPCVRRQAQPQPDRVKPIGQHHEPCAAAAASSSHPADEASRFDLLARLPPRLCRLLEGW